MPEHHRTAVILAIGDEITLGQTADTNSQRIAETLTGRGITPTVHVTVADDLDRLTRAIAEASAEADLVILTGGLGPTADDLTRQALASATDDELVEDPEARAHITQWFSERGRRLHDANLVQALRPSRGRCMPNPNGTAPGVATETSAADVYCLPGPPREMVPMLRDYVLPNLRPAAGVRTRVLRTVGAGESDIAAALADFMHRDRNPLVGTTASEGIVSVRIRYTGSDDGAALIATESAVRDILGPIIFTPTQSDTDPSLPEVILDLLRAHSKTLAVCESCTGGMLAAAITDVPGSSDAFLGGFLTYSNLLKSNLAGVDPAAIERHGAVSREVAVEMAAGTRARLGTDHALAITGIAGPGGGSDAKPVGTVWIALDSHDRPAHTPGNTRCFRFPSDRIAVRRRSVVNALAMVRMQLIGDDRELLGQIEPSL